MNSTQQFKLANILLDVPEQISEFPEMMYRANGKARYDAASRSLTFSGDIDFLTYFNAFSAVKWREYAQLKEVFLHLELSEDPCEIILLGVKEDALAASDAPGVTELCVSSAVKKRIQPQIVDTINFDGTQEAFDISVDTSGMLIVGFKLISQGTTTLANAFWYTEVEANRIRSIRIALATTTFKNERYILPNIELVCTQLLALDEPVARGLHMFVVDNGQTLDVKALSHDGVTVFPNPNEGGSAGFARGMMEALADGDFTHVLLMDDDVRISPESILRTFNLLSLAQGEYENAFINGAMLEMEYPNKQFEDISHVRHDGIYQRIKGNLFMDTLEDVAMNELLPTTADQIYGAWWYACIPLSAVRENGLPLPFFVRCDDVEYGMPCKPTYMTMNGICVWHAAFTHKFRAAVDSYQYIRNYMIMNALHGISSEAMFMARISRVFRMYLRGMAYETCELMIKGLEDYLRGPKWLMNASGEALFKENNAASEPLTPLPEALAQASFDYPEWEDAFRNFVPNEDAVSENRKANDVLRYWRTLPYDRHLLPDALLTNKPGTAYYGGWTDYFPEQARTRVLVACDRECENAHVRVMDRARWRELRNRWKHAVSDYKKRGNEVAEAYRMALPKLTSVDFWRDHLGLNDSVHPRPFGDRHGRVARDPMGTDSRVED